MDIIEFRPFEIGQKEYINRFFGEHHYERADCSFDTLFLWQHAYHTMWAVEDGVLFIRAGYGDQTFFMPPFAGDGASFTHGLALIRDHLAEMGKPFMIKAASPWVVEKIQEFLPGKFNFVEDRDNWEYIYRTQDLITLPGKKFRMKKNHLNSFLRQYGDYVYEPITVDNTEETKAEWFARHGDIEEEKQAISLAFANWEALGMRGAVIRIYGRIEALTMGSFLNERVAHIHFEKANPEIRGLYQAINREFLAREFSTTEFVNREEDLGLPGLRQAKMEYNPDHFAEKYDVTLAE
mgnify:FL=1